MASGVGKLLVVEERPDSLQQYYAQNPDLATVLYKQMGSRTSSAALSTGSGGAGGAAGAAGGGVKTRLQVGGEERELVCLH